MWRGTRSTYDSLSTTKKSGARFALFRVFFLGAPLALKRGTPRLSIEFHSLGWRAGSRRRSAGTRRPSPTRTRRISTPTRSASWTRRAALWRCSSSSRVANCSRSRARSRRPTPSREPPSETSARSVSRPASLARADEANEVFESVIRRLAHIALSFFLSPSLALSLSPSTELRDVDSLRFGPNPEIDERALWPRERNVYVAVVSQARFGWAGRARA